jgi:hypothetical protein
MRAGECIVAWFSRVIEDGGAGDAIEVPPHSGAMIARPIPRRQS